MGGGMSIEMWRAERDDVAVPSRLQHRVFEEFEWEVGLDAQAVTVDVTDRAVILSGTVNNYPQKVAAERGAKRVHGVQEVKSTIAVALAADDARSDKSLARAIGRALRSDVLVPRDAVRVTVLHGVVQLEGMVSSDAERRAAEDITACLVGVRDIVNLIGIDAGFATAGDVKARVEAAIERQPELHGDHIKVEVVDETIALHGRVRSLAERDEAQRAARMVPGVTLVRDDLRIS